MTPPGGKPLGLTVPITLGIFLQGVTLRLYFLATIDVLLPRLHSADHNIHSHNRYWICANRFVPRL